MVVPERSSSPWFTLYPNPTSGPLTVRCAVGRTPATLRISDTMGRTLRSITLTHPITHIDVSGTKGLLQLELISAERAGAARIVVE